MPTQGTFDVEISLAKGIIFRKIGLANGAILKPWAAHPGSKFSREHPPPPLFTLLRFCEAHCWIMERFQRPPFLWISTFDSVFENIRFCGVFVQISVNTFTKTELFLSVFVQYGAV